MPDQHNTPSIWKQMQQESMRAELMMTSLASSCERNAGFRLACRSPLCPYIAWSPLAVSWFAALSSHAALASHQAASLLSWTEVNCMRSAAVGKVVRFRLSIYWQDTACRSVIPLRQVALAQLYKYYHQSGNAVSGKLVWKQH